MFRHPLHSFLRLVMAFSLSAAAPALAAPDVTQVTLTVTFAEVSSGAPEIDAVFRVVGMELNNGTIKFPSAPGVSIPLQDDAGDLVLGVTFQSQAELDLALPAGNYAL